MNTVITHTHKSLTKRFYKDKGLWYIDLPEFLEAGAGTPSDLLMVDGSDRMLDMLSGNTGEVTVRFSNRPSDAHDSDAFMHIAESGMNRQVLDAVGHAPIGYGRYYNSVATLGGIRHVLRTWLCPVAEWIFGYYPETIWVKIVNM